MAWRLYHLLAYLLTPVVMSASFYRVFLLVVLVLGASLASTPDASAAPSRNRFLPSVRAKIKGHNRLHRPVYRTYRG